MKLKTAIAALVAAPLALAAAETAPSQAPDSIDLRVGTCNVRYDNKGDDKAGNGWNDRKADLAAFLRRLDMDVFGMQEAHENQVADLGAALPEWTIVNDFDVTTAVAYRSARFDLVKKGVFWLSETPDVPRSLGWGAQNIRPCLWMILADKATGRRFCFINTHTDHRSALARIEGTKLIMERMKTFSEGLPIVFVGDHNCGPAAEPSAEVRRHLNDARDIAEVKDPGPVNTFHGWGSITGGIARRCDYIYVSPGIRVKDFITHGDRRPGLDRYPTDHYPLTASVSIPLEDGGRPGKNLPPPVGRVQEIKVWRGETTTRLLDGCAEKATARAVASGAMPAGISVTTGVAHEVRSLDRPMGTRYMTLADRVEWGSTAGGVKVVRVKVSPDAKPGEYMIGALKVSVIDRVLPPPSEWRYYLDLWQHPWAVSRYAGVEPFTKAHYDAMRPLWETLADAGQKALTVTLLDLPWNHQCYDAYRSMVRRVKRADGTWLFDYSLLDEYIAFGKSCGIGPDVACYTMCPWEYVVSWEDESGARRSMKALPGTPEFEDYWGPFLEDFAAHMKERGWLDHTFIAMDERSPADVRNIASLVARRAPGLKLSLAGNRAPSEFDGIRLDNCCFGLQHLTDSLLSEARGRRALGMTTTFYVCCGPRRPNTLAHNELEESFWLGAYPAMAGLDGFLRWAWNSWPRDPVHDISFGDWAGGDTFLVYPDGSPSLRFLELRNGIVVAEKMRILEEAGRLPPEARALAAGFDRRAALDGKADFRALRRKALSLVNPPPPPRP